PIPAPFACLRLPPTAPLFPYTTLFRSRLPLLVALLAVLGLAGSAGGGIPIPPPPGDSLPTWSPDGSVIVFLSDRDGTSLRVMNRSEEHTSELQSRFELVCRLLLEKKTN